MQQRLPFEWEDAYFNSFGIPDLWTFVSHAKEVERMQRYLERQREILFTGKSFAMPMLVWHAE